MAKPVIEPYAPFTIDPSAKVFHYGQAIFEGMKAYKDQQDDVWLFRPDENFHRFNKSAIRMAMPEVPEDIFLGGLHRLLEIEKNGLEKEKKHTIYPSVYDCYWSRSNCGTITRVSFYDYFISCSFILFRRS